MSNPYPMLTYAGDLLRDGDDPTGGLLGWDETFTPYEVMDVEVGPECAGECYRTDIHSHVYLQYARAETMKAHGEAFAEAMRSRGLLP
jgi:hypothetical protein